MTEEVVDKNLAPFLQLCNHLVGFNSYRRLDFGRPDLDLAGECSVDWTHRGDLYKPLSLLWLLNIPSPLPRLRLGSVKYIMVHAISHLPLHFLQPPRPTLARVGEPRPPSSTLSVSPLRPLVFRCIERTKAGQSRELAPIHRWITSINEGDGFSSRDSG